jgi:hypothetical protein
MYTAMKTIDEIIINVQSCLFFFYFFFFTLFKKVVIINNDPSCLFLIFLFNIFYILQKGMNKIAMN